MRRIGLFARGLAALALLAVALGACSPSAPSSRDAQKNADWVRNEFLKLENSGEPIGETFKAIRETDNALYQRMMKIFAEEIARGKRPAEAGEAARPLYMEQFAKQMRYLEDDDVGAMLDITLKELASAAASSPMACVKLGRGENDPAFRKFPKEVQDAEFRLMARAMRLKPRDLPTASEEEATAWVTALTEAKPDLLEGLSIVSLPAPSDTQAKMICEASRALMEDLKSKEPAERARLFRRLQVMAAT